MLAGGIASKGKRGVEVIVEPEKVSKAVGDLAPSTTIVIAVFLCSTAVPAAAVHERLWGGNSHSGE
jgi:hypothetical protein